MTLASQVAAIHSWNKAMHPLTCAFCNCREPLEPLPMEKRVILFCDQCGGVQEWVPEVVFSAYELRVLKLWCGVCE